MEHRVRNRLTEIRKGRGVAAAELARRAGVTRQTIYAIESGSYLPNTELALLIAQELEVRVDEIFSLMPLAPLSPDSMSAEVLTSSGAPPAKGQPVRVCQVDGASKRWVAVPVSATPYLMPEADGVLDATSPAARLLVVSKQEAEADSGKRLVLAGCDPATGMLSRMVERETQVEILSAPASSRLALSWLKEGKVHIAGSHLEDPATGEFNLPYIRQEFPKRNEILVVTFARWEEGLVVAPGNPKALREVADLIGNRNVQIVNREPGSGSRALLDKLLAGADARLVKGYESIAYGHLAAAYQVLSGGADACLATRSAAQTFGLDFIPLHSARYDLVMRRQTAELPAVRAFLDVLQRATLRRKLELLAGYDTTETGVQLTAA